MSYLERWHITPGTVTAMPPRLRDRVVDACLRWGQAGEAEACLRAVLAQKPYVTQMDRLAQALAAQDRTAEALAVMAERLALKPADSAQQTAARLALEGGDAAPARAYLAATTSTRVEGLRFALHLVEGDFAAARAVCDVITAAAEGSPPWLMLARLAVAEGDAARAVSCANHVKTQVSAAQTAPAHLVSELAVLYRAAADQTGLAWAERTLAEMQTAELNALDTELEPYARAANPAVSTVTPPPPVAVSDEERQRLQDVLVRVFGHAELREGQAEVMAAVLRGESVLAVMPTGAGKSLCYQLPALLLPQVTLVISPLIALMKDQVDSLPPDLAAVATFINSSLDNDELARRLLQVRAGEFKLVYAAPERLRQPPFLHALRQVGISLLVVDEAHCVSLWGHDFRPDYLFIHEAVQALGAPTVLAMTATAPPAVAAEIERNLSPQGKMTVVLTDIHRPNLVLSALQAQNQEEKLRTLLQIVRSTPGSGIVYVSSRRNAEEVAEFLRRRQESAVHYHAGIANRAAVQDQFMSGRARIVVATVAFGMGIDKADIRFIVHYNPARSLEAYYQEAGRAGRDGRPAACTLLFTSGDAAVLKRHAGADVPGVDALRGLYRTVAGLLPSRSPRLGLVDPDRLLTAVRGDVTTLRVGIQFLERAGLLRRGFDTPVSVMLTWHDTMGQPEALTAFARAAGLVYNRGQPVDMLAAAVEAGLDAPTIEFALLDWAVAGHISLQTRGRQMLLQVLDAPKDARQRITGLLDAYQVAQTARVSEIVGYAATTACRHGHLSAYFGALPITHCGVCDNCGAAAPELQTAEEAPDVDGAAGLVVLQCVDGLTYYLGRSGLTHTLLGSVRAPASGRKSAYYNALGSLSEKIVRGLVDRALEQGDLEAFEKDGYKLLRLTGRGQARLGGASRVVPTASATREPMAVRETASGSPPPADEMPVWDDSGFVPEELPPGFWD